MEANKDAALHYLELAERAILTGDNGRALRYINKSEELFPTPKAKDLRNRIKTATSHSTSDSTAEQTTTDHDHAHTTNGTSTHSRHRTISTSANDYTSEEVEAVRKIKACKDLYEILGVSKTSSEADLKKAYRKLALQFHPDKCKAPGATEAFKAIGKAFSILSDPKKREDYDQYGQAMEPQYQRGHSDGRRSGQQYYNSDEDDDFSAEEIFNLFFGYSGPNNRAYRRRQRGSTFHFTTHSTQNQTSNPLTQLLPYLLLFLISIIGTFLVSEPQFQMHRNGKYQVPRTVRPANIQYYVKSDFRAPTTKAEIDKLESSVIEEYVSDLRHQCYREQQHRESMLWRARMMNDNSLFHQASQLTTPSCTKLNDFIRSHA